MKRNIAILLLSVIALSTVASNPSQDIIDKHVRTFIKKGNEAYRANDFTKAETYYREAIAEDKNSSPSYFNLALTLLRKNGNPLKGNTAATENGENKNDNSTNPVAMFENVISLNNDANLVTSAFYNLGNIYFEAEKYAESIENYKNVLRRDPDNIKARQNLRIAQLKQEEQQKNQQQNKNNQDQDKNNQNQDQNKQNQDQNQNKDKKDENKDKNDQSTQNPQQNQPPQQQNQGGSSAEKPAMSKENSEKILESARKQEEQTRKKVEKRKGDRTTRRTTDRPW